MGTEKATKARRAAAGVTPEALSAARSVCWGVGLLAIPGLGPFICASDHGRPCGAGRRRSSGGSHRSANRNGHSGVRSQALRASAKGGILLSVHATRRTKSSVPRTYGTDRWRRHFSTAKRPRIAQDKPQRFEQGAAIRDSELERRSPFATSSSFRRHRALHYRLQFQKGAQENTSNMSDRFNICSGLELASWCTAAGAWTGEELREDISGKFYRWGP